MDVTIWGIVGAITHLTENSPAGDIDIR